MSLVTAPAVFVQVELQGFQTVTRENVNVLVGQTTPIDLALRVATLAETVTVTGTSPVIDTTSANVSVNLSEQLLQATPGGRDIWALVEYKVPSLLITRPDVGGTSGGLQGVYNARGTTSGQNSQYLNGINVGDPAAIGAAGFYYDYDAFEDIQVSTGAHDITVPTSGVFLNMVTKSGGDRWAGRGTFAWLGDATQSSNIDARVGLNTIFFPTYLNGNDQTLLDSATNIRTRNFTTGTERWRDRLQANATGNYYIDQALGGRHEFKFGFDHAHATVENRVSRFDDLEVTYSSSTGRSQDVTLFATPFYSKTGVDVTALYAQDSYAVKRLTLVAGVRWERLEA